MSVVKYFSLVFCLVAGFVRAQEYPSLLWEIKGKGITEPSYLYGTVHSFDSAAFSFVPAIAPKIAASDIFAMEMILDMQNQDIMSMMQFIVMPGDTALSTLLDAVQYERLDRYMTDSVGFPMVMFGRVKPFFIMAMMMQSDLKFESSRFLDDSLSQIASLAKKKIIGIETMEEQFAAIDRIPLAEQARMLMEEVDSAIAGGGSGQLDDLIGAYATGSLDSLHAMYLKKELSNSFELALVTDRNHRMADRIESTLADNVRMFVAVGALHLPGEEGIIELLRKKGYSVTPIKLN